MRKNHQKTNAIAVNRTAVAVNLFLISHIKTIVMKNKQSKDPGNGSCCGGLVETGCCG